jgi:hypothetical protein
MVQQLHCCKYKSLRNGRNKLAFHGAGYGPELNIGKVLEAHLKQEGFVGRQQMLLLKIQLANRKVCGSFHRR